MLLIVNADWSSRHPTLGWDTGGEIEVRVVPGNHRTYLVDSIDAVADRLRPFLDGTDSRPTLPT
jgi:hypothetical protein